MNDPVTGARTAVELTVPLEPGRVWELITDVARIGEWSPETVHAVWLTADGPRAGARYRARNEYGGGFVATVECVVTEAEEPVVFEWVVLDDDQRVDAPGSIWRYELEPAATGTLIRQTFTHGPGLTGLREYAGEHPDHAAEIVAGRLAELRRNMLTTLTAMTS